jgi:hypothetical protein
MRDEARVRETKSRMYRDRSGLLVNPKVRQAIQGWVGASVDAVEIGSALFTLVGLDRKTKKEEGARRRGSTKSEGAWEC